MIRHNYYKTKALALLLTDEGEHEYEEFVFGGKYNTVEEVKSKIDEIFLCDAEVISYETTVVTMGMTEDDFFLNANVIKEEVVK